MQIENSIKPISPVFLQNDSTQFSQYRETFHDILQRTLKNVSSSRPPKIELTGVLVPCSEVVQGYHCKYKLETDTSEYFLSMSDNLSLIAKKIEWDEVSVKGFLDTNDNLLEVEKISLVQKNESILLNTPPPETYFEFDQYERTIAQRGKLDLAPEYLAS